ncbi:MAG: FtsX-like permease family protein [bacterium]|nr:FtsX-like permease family protein [bacterium]
MLKNYLKIAFRNIVRYKGYSTINILGLAIGMACCILILLWVQDELEFDKFHENYDNIYRVLNGDYPRLDDKDLFAVSCGSLAKALKDEYPEVISSVRVTDRSGFLQYGSKNFMEESILLTDPSFFEVFSFSLIEGDPETSLSNKYSIIISEDMAEKYFGNEDPIGKTMIMDYRHNLLVTGVVKNTPGNTHLKFDFLAPFTLLEEYDGNLDNWNFNNYYTYILLNENTDHDDTAAKIFLHRTKITEESSTRYILQPLSRMHLHESYRYDRFADNKGSINNVYVFSIVAVFILLIGCINFMNLSTARSGSRAREVGMRKVVGARRNSIMAQFYSESFIMVIISVVLAFILVIFLLPEFNRISGKNISFDIFTNWKLMCGLISIIAITGLVSGSYPALYLSSFQPVKVIKGVLNRGLERSAFRKVLVVTQFSMSIILIITTIIIHSQLEFMKNTDLGFEKEHIIYFQGRGEIIKNAETLKSELMQNPNILDFTFTNLHSEERPSANFNSWEGKSGTDSKMFSYFHVDYNTLELFGMEIKEGRFYSKEYGSDANIGLIINEAAAEAMEMESPLGKWFGFGSYQLKILGVVKDFNYKSLHWEVEPILFYPAPDVNNASYASFFVKIQPSDISGTLDYIKEAWSKIEPDFPFDYSFIDERFDRMYDSERRTGTIFNYFSVLAIFIACLGLFGLASYMAEQRRKEIGIRKVLGSSVNGIVRLISLQFVRLIIISNFLAWPAAWLFSNYWLQSFAYRTNVSWSVFILTTCFTLLLTFITIGYQSLKASLTNPVDSLRYE